MHHPIHLSVQPSNDHILSTYLVLVSVKPCGHRQAPGSESRRLPSSGKIDVYQHEKYCDKFIQKWGPSQVLENEQALARWRWSWGPGLRKDAWRTFQGEVPALARTWRHDKIRYTGKLLLAVIGAYEGGGCPEKGHGQLLGSPACLVKMFRTHHENDGEPSRCNQGLHDQICF